MAEVMRFQAFGSNSSLALKAFNQSARTAPGTEAGFLALFAVLD
jgi:hypothetical protein